MHNDRRRLVILLLAMSSVVTAHAARDEVPPRSGTPCLARPQTLRVEPRFERTIDEMCQRSPMFRRQLTRLAAAGLLVVTIDFCAKACPSTLRAQTTIKYRSNVLTRADIRIQWRPQEYPELIAHELEHVIEQLDGVDLPRLDGGGTEEVRRNASGHYETTRAHQIGRIVAAEYRAGVGVALACERKTP